ncbi:hypothetical protein AB0M02_20665 [Actinoplanes sp. NPDC051861]|uniref:hypothetical protein n=1 Tax=Actinoplanes sp. NPDC051861 TaxID=3155170 RepID=UPI00342336CF
MALFTLAVITTASPSAASPSAASPSAPLPSVASSSVASPPPALSGKLLTGKDVPAAYEAAAEDPFAHVLEVLFDPGSNAGVECRLPVEVPRAGFTPGHSVSAVFVTKPTYWLDVKSLTQVVAEPGRSRARALVDAAAALPQRCPKIDTPGYTMMLKPMTLPALGDRSAAFTVDVMVKAVGMDNAYVDAMLGEVSVVSRRGVTSVVILMGYSFLDHVSELPAVTRKAAARLTAA